MFSKNAQDYESPIVRFGMWFVGVMSLVICPIAGYATVTGVLDARASLHWPTAQGKILRSRVERQQLSALQGKTSYWPKVDYEYIVARHRYHSSQIGRFEFGFPTQEEAAGVVARYPAGRDVKVYYNPANVEQSFLEPGLPSTHYFLLLLPPGMAAFGIVCCWSARASKKRAQLRKQAAAG